MAINIKQLALHFFKNRISLSLEDVENLFQHIYEEGCNSLKRKATEPIQSNVSTTLDPDDKIKIQNTFNPQPHYDNSK